MKVFTDWEMGREVYDLFVEICPVVLSGTLADTDRARDLLIAVAGISARDAVHAAVLLNDDIEWIASYDSDSMAFPATGG